MPKWTANIFLLLKRLGIALLMFTICRLLFFVFNKSLFHGVNAGAFWGGFWFDLAAISMFFSPFILFSLVPFSFREKKGYGIFLSVVFHIANGLCIILNCIDFEFFKFTNKRTTADVFDMLSYGNDAQNLLPTLLKSYWYVALTAIALIILSIYLFRKFASGEAKMLSWKTDSILLIIAIPVFILLARGGFGVRPINIVHASRYAEPQNIPVVLNTPFTIIKTWNYPALEPLEFYPDEEVKTIFDPVVQYRQPASPNGKGSNVILFILESFSYEYIGKLSGRKTCTPFLDSLMDEGLIFTHAFSNGKRSIEAMPSIVASIPTLMNTPYISSPYSGNNIDALGTLMKKMGYATAFFHGASNGSMGFDAFSKISGFDSYYGQTEFGDDSKSDGTWGIFDEEFFRFFGENLNTLPQPFCAGIFTLTSHHPYPIPNRYQSRFSEHDHPMNNVIMYSDFALQTFFDYAKKQEWYNNTLFVFVADHTSDSEDPFYSNCLGRYKIPLLFFHPSDSTLKGKNSQTVQQIDVLPSVLHYAGYSEPFFCFGKSVFDTDREHYAVNLVNDIFQYTDNDYLLQFANEESIALFNIRTDSLLQNNLLETEKEKAAVIEKKAKAFLQTYHNSLIRNKTSVNGK
ncbi:MAG: LTA synthase family protein [Bacteroidota bacterium]